MKTWLFTAEVNGLVVGRASFAAEDREALAMADGLRAVLSLPLAGKVVITPAGDGVETVEEAKP